jgi:Tfp pilus assembly protein PilX
MRSRLKAPRLPRREAGIVLIVALILLAALSLAGVALIRSTSTTSIVAGNLAFHQGATHASDKAVESAIAWLETKAVDVANPLFANATASGYWAAQVNPGAGKTWLQFWNESLASGAQSLPIDAGGNTVSFVIHRLCKNAGDPSAAECATPVSVSTGCQAGSSCSGTGDSPLLSTTSLTNGAIYYRITALVTGPRNTRSFVQAIYAM